jgi:DNA-binding NtrC family response regulator
MPTILIVDDEPDLLRAWETVLTLEGYRVRTTTSPEKALLLLDIERPHLVLLDINLPGPELCDGLDLLRRMRAQMPAVAIVMVSGYLYAETRRAALAAGALDCWQKPVSLGGLKQCVAQVLATPGIRRVYTGIPAT